MRKAYPKFWPEDLKMVAHGISLQDARREIKKLYELDTFDRKERAKHKGQRHQEEEVQVYNMVVCFFSFFPPLVSFNLLFTDLTYLCYIEYCLPGPFNYFSLFNAIYFDFWNTNSLFTLIFAFHCNLVFANRVGYRHQCEAFVLWTRPSWRAIIVWPVRNLVWLYMTYVVVQL